VEHGKQMRRAHELGHVEISQPSRTHSIRTQMVLEGKPIKHIELTKAEWLHLRENLVREHGQKILISWVMRRECGFTIREHTQWDRDYSNHHTVYCLDFYDEQMKVWYLLKYN